MIRVVSAAALIALLVVTVWWLPPVAIISLAVLTAALGAVELVGLARASGAVVPAPLVALLAAAVCFLGSYGTGDVRPLLVAGLVAVAVLIITGRAPDRTTITRAAVVMGGPVYLGLPLALIVGISVDYGPHGVSTLALMVIVSDSAQYFAGRAFGRRKLAPLISPAKTIEGAIGGVIASAAVGAWLINWARPDSTIEATMAGGAMVGAAVAIAGMLGDLFESALKRGAGVKDSSALIPGHGGVLDRIDSWLFAGPVFSLFLRYFV